MIIWTPDARSPEYTQAVVWQGCVMRTDDLPDFEAFVMNHMGAKHPPKNVGCVINHDRRRNYDPDYADIHCDPNYDPDYDSIDYVFLVHDEDAANREFCVKRLNFGMRWLEDVIMNDPDMYPRDFRAAYPVMW
jgi:hypothetical protein